MNSYKLHRSKYFDTQTNKQGLAESFAQILPVLHDIARILLEYYPNFAGIKIHLHFRGGGQSAPSCLYMPIHSNQEKASEKHVLACNERKLHD